MRKIIGLTTGLVIGMAMPIGIADSGMLVVPIKSAKTSQIEIPVGAIIAWHKDLEATVTLPNGWVECNGQVLTDPDSPYNGLAIPNLNGAALFLRGGETSGAMQNDTVGLHDHNVSLSSSAAENHTHNAEVNVAETGPHTHSASTGITNSGLHQHSATGNHSHGIGASAGFGQTNALLMASDASRTNSSNNAGEHQHAVAGDHGHAAATSISSAGNHNHNATATVVAAGGHSHNVS